MATPHIPTATESEVLNELIKGTFIKDIVKNCGVAINTIYRIQRRHNLQRNAKHEVKPKRDRKDGIHSEFIFTHDKQLDRFIESAF